MYIHMCPSKIIRRSWCLAYLEVTLQTNEIQHINWHVIYQATATDRVVCICGCCIRLASCLLSLCIHGESDEIDHKYPNFYAVFDIIKSFYAIKHQFV